MATKPHTTEAQMRAVADKMFKAWNAHDVGAILEHLTDDVVWVEPSLPEPIKGKEAVEADLRATFKAFPDMHFPADDFHAFSSVPEQTGVVTWTLTATMTGPLETGVPATGKAVRISGTNVSRFRNGKISEYTTHYDSLSFMQQLGLLPRTGGLGFKALVLADVAVGRAEALVGKARHMLQRS